MNYPTDQRHGGARAASATWAWIVAACTLGYMLPWAVAAHRGARNSAQVFWLNLLLGWTMIGWVVALVMALRVHQPVMYPPPGGQPWAPPPGPGAPVPPPAAAYGWVQGPDGQMQFAPPPGDPRNPLHPRSAINQRLRNNPTAMKVIPVFVLASFALLVVAIVMPGDKDPASASPSTNSASSTTPTKPDAPKQVQPAPDPEPAKPSMTAGQSNAVRSAADYLKTAAFSRKGLIDQLKFEGFSVSDATYAVDHVEVSWKEQAAKSARDYLDTSGFSRSGLIEQLEFEGFTPTQARYGATAAGL